jgi:hypothetical protein
MPKLKVLDTSATSGSPVRVHEMIVNGQIKQYTFHVGQYLEMEEEEALKFNKDGFLVKQIDGGEIEKPAAGDDYLKARLKPGETIANFSELSAEALKVRAALLPNGEKLVKMKKDDMVKALLEAAGVTEEDDLLEDDEAAEAVVVRPASLVDTLVPPAQVEPVKPTEPLVVETAAGFGE